MLRTHNNGELRLADVNQTVTLCGWVQRSRDKGGMIWIDLRDRYGITQLMLEEGKTPKEILDLARTFGREFVISATGLVVERLSKNDKIATGDIEIKIESITSHRRHAPALVANAARLARLVDAASRRR